MSGQHPRQPSRRRAYVPVVGPRLRKLLLVVFGLFSLLAINAGYLGGVTLMEWLREETFQGYFYQLMFLAHLVLGLMLVLPVVVYGVLHLRVAPLAGGATLVGFAEQLTLELKSASAVVRA